MNKNWRKHSFVRLLRNWSGLIGLILVVAYVTVAIFAETLAPFPPNEQHPADRLQPPGPVYRLGTDEFGRDLLSRLIFGARNSLQVAVSSVAAAALLGVAIGVLAAYIGGLSDNVIMRVIDLLFAFPAILLALFIAAVLGPGARNTIIAIAVVYLPIFARVGRATALDIKDREFVDAARSLGAGHLRIIGRHILPNATAPIIVQVSLALSWAILTEASLSFLGLGVIPPAPSWGSMLSESRVLMELAPWTVLMPGIAIMVAILGFNLLGDGLRDVLDPKLQ
jgi:peptide/nickel transport system permease protein